MINAQHAHIYRIHTLHFIFGELYFLKILSKQPLSMCNGGNSGGGAAATISAIIAAATAAIPRLSLVADVV
jgi:hypothetical protein